MFRTTTAALLSLLLCAAALPADEVRGKIKKVDADKGTLTLTVDGKDQEVKLPDDTKLLGPSGADLKDGLQSTRLTEGAEVTVFYEKKGDKEVCVKVQLKGVKKD